MTLQPINTKTISTITSLFHIKSATNKTLLNQIKKYNTTQNSEANKIDYQRQFYKLFIPIFHSF